jgi:hypothetical protein
MVNGEITTESCRFDRCGDTVGEPVQNRQDALGCGVLRKAGEDFASRAAATEGGILPCASVGAKAGRPLLTVTRRTRSKSSRPRLVHGYSFRRQSNGV